MINAQPWVRIESLLREAGLSPERHLPLLRAYAEAAIRWNRSVSNLFSSNDESNFVTRHLAESLGALSMARAIGADSWLDLGSGAGLPAIPLSLCEVGERWTLVESRRMKTLFLIKLLSDMTIKNVSVVCDRLENLTTTPPYVGAFDAMTSRATMRAEPTLRLAECFLRKGGQLLLWKGSSWESELPRPEGGERTWRMAEVLQLPDSRCVVLRIVFDESE